MDQTTPLSLAEHQALQELDAYGFDCAPAYIGRARRHFQDAGSQPTTSQILEQVFVMAAADDAVQQRLGVSIEDAKNYARLRSLDFELTQQLAALLRETVELERAKRPAGVFGQAGSKIRLTLYPPAQPAKAKLYTRLAQLGPNRCLLNASLGRNAEFINLEITLT